MTDRPSLEFTSLSPASNIRQRVTYSIGDEPTVASNRKVKADRDMRARSARPCNVQRCDGSLFSALIAADGKAAADQKEVTAAVERDNAPVARRWKDRARIHRRQGEVAGQAEWPPARQYEAVTLAKAHGFRYALHGQPTFSGNHGVAL